jgi:hypothetical protein
MNIKLDHFHVFVVKGDWFNLEFATLEQARKFVQDSVSDGHNIEDFSIEGRMWFEVE